MAHRTSPARHHPIGEQDFASSGCAFSAVRTTRRSRSVGGSWGQSSAPLVAVEHYAGMLEYHLGSLSAVGRRTTSQKARSGHYSPPRTGINHSCPMGCLAPLSLPLRPRRVGSAFTACRMVSDALWSHYTRGPAGAGLFIEFRCFSFTSTLMSGSIAMLSSCVLDKH